MKYLYFSARISVPIRYFGGRLRTALRPPLVAVVSAWLLAPRPDLDGHVWRFRDAPAHTALLRLGAVHEGMAAFRSASSSSTNAFHNLKNGVSPRPPASCRPFLGKRAAVAHGYQHGHREACDKCQDVGKRFRCHYQTGAFEKRTPLGLL